MRHLALLALLFTACSDEEGNKSPGGSGDAATDSDHDGTPDATDCAPEDASIHPGAVERCNDLDEARPEAWGPR